MPQWAYCQGNIALIIAFLLSCRVKLTWQYENEGKFELITAYRKTIVGAKRPDNEWLCGLRKQQNWDIQKINRMNCVKGEDMILNDLLLASQYFGKK